ncbi:hypothetical protein NQ317_009241 [Molorchus minor]|uniref:Protein kinase domain-containing protein n=1 Tax=Molorchus minor TaxID=1323400 RepID=A0ABQ9IX26_9CUCU|nr:hypothetical protein NQ317_009241 [Molorchus minor]
MERTSLQREIILTRQLNHPNVLPYYTTFVSGCEVCVVSPLMAYGSCKDLLTRHFNEGLPEQAIILMTRDILDGLNYIHGKGYIHRIMCFFRSIRASHILISASGQACIAGLRYACPIVMNGKWQKHIHSFPVSTERNLNWLSPELLEQNLQVIEKESISKEYYRINKDVKKNTRRDERKCIDRIVTLSEEAAAAHSTKELYKNTKLLTNKNFRNDKPIQNKDQPLITTIDQQMCRWQALTKRALTNQQ